MHDSKDFNWAADYQASAADEAEAKEAREDVAESANDSNGADGWQQYRRWISKAPAPKTRRSGIDPSLYSWKGYRNWTEEVKRNWTDNKDS